VALRPSGLVWCATLVPALASGWRWGPPRRVFARAAVVLLAWAAGTAPLLASMGSYLGDKMTARARYAAHVEPMLRELTGDLGIPFLVAAVPGLLWMAVRRPRGQPARLVLLAWLTVALLLHAFFHSGMDNFLVLVPALAILAAEGLARLGPRLLALPAAALLVFVASTWLPQGLVRAAWTSVPGAAGPFDASPDTWLRPWRGFGAREVGALLDATCPAPSGRADADRCRILAERGLFDDYVEEPGRLELFLLRRDQVKLVGLDEVREQADPRGYAAFVRFTCPQTDSAWEARDPGSSGMADGVARAGHMALAWGVRLAGDCTYRWLTPSGIVARPEHLPDPRRFGQPLRPGGP
jgi:hypothetical protein